MDSRREERPVTQQGNPDAPTTTEAVPKSVTRIGLHDTLSDLPPGSVVEINLIGSGASRAYALMIVHPYYSDAEMPLVAADIMTRCVSDLKRAFEEQRHPDDLEEWRDIVRRLCWVEGILDNSSVPGSHPLATLIERGRELLLAALQDELYPDTRTRSTALETLERSLQWCLELAEQSWAAVQELRQQHAEVFYEPFGSGELAVNYPAPMLQGLEKAAKLGLDMGALELGYILCGDAVVSLRGRRPREQDR